MVIFNGDKVMCRYNKVKDTTLNLSTVSRFMCEFSEVYLQQNKCYFNLNYFSVNFFQRFSGGGTRRSAHT